MFLTLPSGWVLNMAHVARAFIAHDESRVELRMTGMGEDDLWHLEGDDATHVVLYLRANSTTIQPPDDDEAIPAYAADFDEEELPF